MAKRFTDTNKWENDWFLELSDKNKVIWSFFCDKCNHAGVWKISRRVFKLCTGKDYDEEILLNEFEDKVIKISNDRIFLPSFIDFQYGELNENNRVHKSVIDILRNFNLLDEKNKVLTSPLLGVKDKDKYKVKDKVKDKDKDSLVSVTHEEIINEWNKRFGKELGYCHGLGAGKHRDNYLTARGYLPTIDNWKNLFDQIEKSDYLMGRNGRWKVNLLWLFDYDNTLKVLNGSYVGPPEKKNAKTDLKAMLEERNKNDP